MAVAIVFKQETVRQVVVSQTPQKNQFSSIQTAINASMQWMEPCEIIIESGDYHESLKIYRNDLSLIGQGTVCIKSCFAACQTYQEKQRGTFQTATLFINGQNIHLQHLTILNEAGFGNEVGQAVAVHIEGTGVSFEHCVIQGFQDTLCLGPVPRLNKDGSALDNPWLKQTFEQQYSVFNFCRIEGTVDFIFGGGNATFRFCHLHARASAQTNYLTAAATPLFNSGMYFLKCQITGEKSYFLGRPWRKYARTLFEECLFDDYLQKVGWSDWQKLEHHRTVRYKERNCLYSAKPDRASWLSIEGASWHEK